MTTITTSTYEKQRTATTFNNNHNNTAISTRLADTCNDFRCALAARQLELVGAPTKAEASAAAAAKCK